MVTAVATVALSGFSPHLAEACSCVPLSVKVWPDAKTEAPLNTRVWVFIPRDIRRADPIIVGGERLPPADAELRVKGGRRVETTRQDFGAADVSIIQLVPRDELRSSTTYEVEVRDGGSDQLFEIHTGPARASEPPTWKYPLTARYLHGMAHGGMCHSGEPAIQLVADDRPVLYGIWSRTDAGAIDYATPPVTYLHASYPSLGFGSICLPRNFLLEPGPLKLGVRMEDLAGNRSTPAELFFPDIPADGKVHEVIQPIGALPPGFVPFGTPVADIEARVLPERPGEPAPKVAMPVALPLTRGAPGPPGVSVRYAFVFVDSRGRVAPGAATRQVAPEYPEEARRRGIGGTVFVQALVGVDGRPERVQVRRAAHSLLDRAARDAVAKWEMTEAQAPDPRNPYPGALSVAITFEPLSPK